ncbi:DUF5590 domain-containing protein [Halobacillus sp. Marseille-P3879]|uniref:cell wall elongation regulator TseB-like domain-containing protein n=1 Tax=Halobacillus sp. Marseille-P3879 TaxID=2045014 RepID=UPI0011AF2DFC|nr:DUF5590 domain-containing protein [Halobacillus sp. Marseille-P3879]
MKMIGTQPSSQFTVPKWGKWLLLILGIVIIILTGFLTWMYLHIENSKTSQYSKAEQFALNEELLEEVNQITRYNGEVPIHILKGVSSDNEEVFIFIDLKNQQELASVSAEDMIGKSTAKSNVNQCTSCEFIDLQLAYEENRPVWEVTYKDESNRYVFEYLDAINGEEVQRFAFRQT